MTKTKLTPAISDRLAYVRSLSLDTGDLSKNQIKCNYDILKDVLS